MVLTSFELWAADGSSAAPLPLDFESNTHTRHLNPFDPRVVPQLNTNLNHLSSNGYYGFSYINAAHIHDNNNNNNMSHNNNNYNGTAYNLMANDVNGMNNTVSTTPQQTNASSVNIGSSAYAAGHAVNVARCKKRYFVIDDDNDTTTAAAVANDYEVSAKRCRFDDDLSAQYCNDFFQLPSTQIATQSCLMDTEEAPQQQQQQEMLQQQVDEAMFENNNNIVKYEVNSNRQLENVQTLSHQNHQQNQHSQQHFVQTQQPTQQQQPPNVYHHQQHYQDMYATSKCHFNNTCDTLTLNNKHSRTCQIDSKCTENKLNSLISKTNKRKLNEHEKLCKNDNDVANDFKVDDATLFAQLHGGCLHHYHNEQFNAIISPTSGIYTNENNEKKNYLKFENICEEF